MTCGGSNEGLACKSGEAARRDAPREECQRELKEKLLQIRIRAVLLPWPVFSLSEIRVAVSRTRGSGQFRWKALVTGFQDPLNTANSGGERMIHLSPPEVNLAFLVLSPKYALLTRHMRMKAHRGCERAKVRRAASQAGAEVFD